MEHLDISGAGFQNVFYRSRSTPLRLESEPEPEPEPMRDMCVENRGLLLEDLLRSAAAVYRMGDQGDPDAPPAVSLSSLFADKKGTRQDTVDRDNETLVVNCGRCMCTPAGGSDGGGGGTPSGSSRKLVAPEKSDCETCGCCGVRQLKRGELRKAVEDLKEAYKKWGQNGDQIPL